MSGLQQLTHSRMSCFRACPRKHWMRYELGIRPAESTHAMRVGSAFHAALEAHALGEPIEPMIDEHVSDPFDKAKVAAMFAGYLERWKDEPLEVVAAELSFTIPLINPETGSPSRTWQASGVIDKIVRLQDGRLAICEHKSTSMDISPGAPYWVQKRVDQQISIYLIAARDLGYDAETILYDVTKRPGQRPLKATPVEKRNYRKRKKDEMDLAEDDPSLLYKSQRDTDEAPAEFAARVAEWVSADPANFMRVEIPRFERDLDECRAEMWQQGISIRAAQRLGFWWRTPASCFEYSGCEYLPICQYTDLESNTPPGFVRVDDVHGEVTRAKEAQHQGDH